MLYQKKYGGEQDSQIDVLREAISKIMFLHAKRKNNLASKDAAGDEAGDVGGMAQSFVVHLFPHRERKKVND